MSEIPPPIVASQLKTGTRWISQDKGGVNQWHNKPAFNAEIGLWRSDVLWIDHLREPNRNHAYQRIWARSEIDRS